MQDKVQTLLRLSDSERSHQRSSNQVENLKKQNQDLSHRLSQATQEKVNALMRVAADGNSSQAAGTGKGMPSPGKTSTWKVCTCSSGSFSLSTMSSRASAPSDHQDPVLAGDCAHAQELQIAR